MWSGSSFPGTIPSRSYRANARRGDCRRQHGRDQACGSGLPVDPRRCPQAGGGGLSTGRRQHRHRRWRHGRRRTRRPRRTDFVTFTGSPAVGASVQQSAARNHIGCTLELGGKSPQIVFEDADFNEALPVLTNAIIQNAGQTCSAGSRLLVQRSAMDRLLPPLAERFRGLRAGPHDIDLDCGPLVSRVQRDRVQAFVDQARADNIPLVASGEVVAQAPAGGYYIPPMLFGPVPEEHVIAREEIFGPILSVIPFEDEADALRLANATDYGLVAGIWTRDGARQMRLARQIRAGQVFINAYGAGGGVELPFGGYGKSGHGREKGFEGLLEFTRIKTVVMRHG
ncbi:MAG: aldehyde dehydrogenase family protein [Geminicoccaceae bacterium]